MAYIKTVGIILAFTLVSTLGRSQSILELTEQLALDAEQLAVLKSTLQQAYQGYEELKTGFTHIRDIVRDNFNLHKAFLDALWVLSPTVRNDPRFSRIPNTATRIVTELRKGSANNRVFTAQESAYINGTFSALLRRCNETLDEFSLVTTDHQLRMSDDQRLQALDRIDAELRAQLHFLQQFHSSLALETVRRRKEAGDINTLKKLYGLPD